MVTINFLFTNLSDANLNLYQATVYGAQWTIQPPNVIANNGHPSFQCQGDNPRATIVYKPDNVRLLTLDCRLDDQTLKVTTIPCEGYRITSAVIGTYPNFQVSATFYKQNQEAEEAMALSQSMS